MTRIQLTDQQINRALAELMGYSLEKAGSFWLLHKDGCYLGNVHYEEEKAYEMLPQFCTDPAASLEVQAAAIQRSNNYLLYLAEIVAPHSDGWDSKSVTALLLATPRERAEAAYITLKEETDNG